MMPRPQCCRRIAGRPLASVFHPAGVPASDRAEVVLTLDEFEAIRLADLEGLYQEEGAGRMHVSRPTFGRILGTAHRKVAEALAHGKALRIEGGTIRVERFRFPRCECPRCRRTGTVAGVVEKSAATNAEDPPCRGVRRRRVGWRNQRVPCAVRTNQEETP